MYQTSYNVLGAVILVPLLYVEVWTGAPLMLALLEAISDDPATRVAVAFLLFNVVPGILLLPIVSPPVVLLQRLWPDTDVGIAARPQSLPPRAAVSPAPDIDLYTLEQGPLVGDQSWEL